MKRIFVICLAAVMVLEGSFSAFAETVEDNPAGTVTENINSTETMKNNEGTVTVNEGVVENNKSAGTVTVNTGTVETNEGTVTVNEGLIEDNKAGGTVTVNTGTVETNEGTVMVNERLIKDNKAGGTVETNTGTVENNEGTITENGSGTTVQVNSGTICSNDGTVEKNALTGSVVLSGEYGEVIDNHGTVISAVFDGSGKLVYSAGGNTYCGITYMDGETEISGESVAGGSTVTIRTGTTKLGYNFVKWTVKTPEGLQSYYYTGGESVNVEDPLWLEAVWEKIMTQSSNGTFTSAPGYMGSWEDPVTGGEWKEVDGKQCYIYNGSPIKNTLVYIRYKHMYTGQEILALYCFDKSGNLVTGAETGIDETNRKVARDNGIVDMPYGSDVDGDLPHPFKCNHPSTVTVPGLAPTSTAPGYKASVQCSVCKATLSGGEEIPATGGGSSDETDTEDKDKVKYAVAAAMSNVNETLKNAYTDGLRSEMAAVYDTQISEDSCMIFDISGAARVNSETGDGGIKYTVNIAYPAGTSAESQDYIAVQLNEDNDAEKVDTFLTNKGIQIEVETLKPVGVAWKNK